MYTIVLPWPAKARHKKIVPVFLPFAGCPARCLYCAQNLQTAEGGRSLQILLQEARTMLEARRHKGLEPAEVAFYGGTFTAQREEALTACLEAVQGWRREGLILSWRCSTRPDALEESVLARMREAGCTCVELGIQSFDSAVLKASLRGYDETVARKGLARVRALGFVLGVQLLPGLPGSTAQGFLQDVDCALDEGAAFLRYYPCLVVRSTGLARLYAEGRYSPWSTEDTLEALALGLAKAFARNVPVIRIGVAREESFEQHVLAGPRDPDLGTRALGRALLRTLQQHVSHADRLVALHLPRSCQGYYLGHRKENREGLERLGVHSGVICWTQEEEVRILLQSKL